MDVGAVGDGIGLAETGKEFLAERDAGDQLAGERAAHLLRRRAVRVGQHRLLQPDLLQRAEHVRPELDAGADFAEFRALLEHADG